MEEAESMDEKNHVIEGIKCFMSMSRMLKMKERENGILRDKIEALNTDNEELNKEVDHHDCLENEELLASEIEELKNSLEAKNEELAREREMNFHQQETLKARMEELESQKMKMEAKSAMLEKNIQNLKASLESSKLRSTNETNSEAENMAHTQMESSTNREFLSSETIETPTHDDRTDSPTSSSSFQTIEIDKNQVEITAKKLIDVMDGYSQNRRISKLPPSLQFEPPAIHQSSDTFMRITDILKIVLANKKVPYRSVQGFWDSLIKQADIAEKVIKEKSLEINRLAGDELKRMEQVHLKEKEKIVQELNDAVELGMEHYFMLTELADKHKLELKEKDEKIDALDREKFKLNKDIAEYKTALFASLEASRKNGNVEMPPKKCEPAVLKCDHLDYRQQLEDLKISSKKIEKELKQKLILAEKKLDWEKHGRHSNVPSNPNVNLKIKPKADPLKDNKKPTTWYNPRLCGYANARERAVSSITDNEEDPLKKFSSRFDPEDKDWLIGRFLKADSKNSK